MMKRGFAGLFPQRFILGAIVSGMTLAGTVAAHADTSGNGPLTAMQTVMGAEKSALAAFAETVVFRRAARLPEQDVSLNVTPDQTDTGAFALARIDAMSAEDAAAATAADGARRDFRMGILTSDRSGAIDLTEIRNIKIGKKTAQWRCLAEALYFEARGETLAGQVAVAEVILNRVESASYPDTLCSVVKQGAHRRNACQFSYACDGRRDVIRERAAFDLSGKIAWVMINGRPRVLTGGATHFHTTAVRPKWSRKLVRTAKIGNHIFYRQGIKLSSR